MAMVKHRKDQHSISPSIRRADLHCSLRAQLRPRLPLVLVLQVRLPIHLEKRRRKRASLRSPLVASGKHLLLVSHLVKNHLRVRRRRRLRLLPSNLRSRLQALLLHHHSRLVLHLLLRDLSVNPLQFLRHRVPRRIIGLHRSASGHRLQHNQQPVHSHLGQAVNLLPLLLATLRFRLERPAAEHLHLVQGQARLPRPLLGLVHKRLRRRRRREDRCLRWGLRHP